MEVSGRELLERFHFPKATRACLASFALVVCLVVALSLGSPVVPFTLFWVLVSLIE